ncbi:hypothetical protein ACLOJK_035511 [Asimina triloba]
MGLVGNLKAIDDANNRKFDSRSAQRVQLCAVLPLICVYVITNVQSGEAIQLITAVDQVERMDRRQRKNKCLFVKALSKSSSVFVGSGLSVHGSYSDLALIPGNIDH